jgi:hypothetical protein
LGETHFSDPATSTSDINQMLERIEQSGQIEEMRKSPAYALGRVEQAQIQNEELFKKAFNHVLDYAERFYLVVRETYPASGLKSVRIGIDEATGRPAALLEFPDAFRDDLKQVRHIARVLESVAWKNDKKSLFLWSLASDKVDEETIGLDFPYRRKSV